MAVFPSFNLTKKGEELLNRSIGEGRVLTFTKFKIGDGVPTEDWRDLVNVQSSFKEFPVLETAIQADQVLRIRGYFDNKGFATDKQFKEIGVFVTLDGVAGEHLYSYTNAGDTGDIIPAESRGFYSRTLDVNNYIGYATNITFNIEQTRDNYDFNTENELKVATFLKKGDKIRLWGRLVLGDIETLNYIVTDEATSLTLNNGLYCKLAGDNRAFTVKTDLVNLKGAVVGDVVEVLGFHAKGDGSHHKRIAKATDDGSGEQGQNGIWWCIVHNGEVNVSWFGAKGNKEIDFTQSFKKICDTFNNVILDRDIMVFGLSVENVNIIGDSTIFIKKGYAVDPETLYYPIWFFDNTHVEGITFDGQQSEGDLYKVADTIIISGENTSITNCKIINSVDSAITFSSAYNSTIKNNIIDNARDLGIYVNNSVSDNMSSIVESNFISNCRFGGISLKRKTSGVLVNANQIFNCGNGITIEGFDLIDNFPTNNIISGNVIRAIGYMFRGESVAERGISCTGGSSFNKIYDNFIEDCTGNGINIAGEGNLIVGNSINLNVENKVPASDGRINGIFIGSGSENTLITENKIFNSVQSIENRGNNSVFKSNFLGKNTESSIRDAGSNSCFTDNIFSDDSGNIVNTSVDSKFIDNKMNGKSILDSGIGTFIFDNMDSLMVGDTRLNTASTAIPNISKRYDYERIIHRYNSVSYFYDPTISDWIPMSTIEAGNNSQRPTNNKIGRFYYNTSTKKIEFYNGSSWKSINFDSTLQQLDTPYYTRKMEEEGIYADYVAYRDELHEYENSQTGDETMLLPVLQEPVIPESVKAFAEKYKLI